MNNAVINIKTDPKVKKQAQKVAEELGFSLSSVLNAYLRQFVRTKEVNFYADEVPNAYLKRLIKKSEEDIKRGRVSSAFDNVDDAIAWLDDPKAKYDNGDNV